MFIYILLTDYLCLRFTSTIFHLLSKTDFANVHFFSSVIKMFYLKSIKQYNYDVALCSRQSSIFKKTLLWKNGKLGHYLFFYQLEIKNITLISLGGLAKVYCLILFHQLRSLMKTNNESGSRVTRSLVLCVCLVNCCLSVCTFLRRLCCLFFFNIPILLTPLVSLNSSCSCIQIYIYKIWNMLEIISMPIW